MSVNSIFNHLFCVQSIPFFGEIEIILCVGRCRYTFTHFQEPNSYLADWVAMNDIVLLFLFMLLFGNIRSESMSSYFSVYENRALNTGSTFKRSTNVKDVMSCARACGVESNCNTANYNSRENKCELFKEQISPEAAMTTARGYHLITKVGIFHVSLNWNLWLSLLIINYISELLSYTLNKKKSYKASRRYVPVCTMYEYAEANLKLQRLDIRLKFWTR